jgi:hypothetical protein
MAKRISDTEEFDDQLDVCRLDEMDRDWLEECVKTAVGAITELYEAFTPIRDEWEQKVDELQSFGGGISPAALARFKQFNKFINEGLPLLIDLNEFNALMKKLAL